ncbi:hypothetical protein [Paraliobacillus sp. X-1268]|uniref:hypothetical protein n=1 Tax=Paraliobacillus sp. X-1268 TaxID=2213193 RepID=UPI000E3B7950|nr:hypothetical protein [Paraliobacillus sp. X-1268]
MKKNLIAFFTFIVLFISSTLTIQASELNVDKNNDDILIEFGFDAETIELMPVDKKQELAEIIIEDPSKVDLDVSYFHLDNLSIIEFFANTDESELQELGLSSEEVELIENDLDDLREITKDEALETLELDTVGYKMLQNALEENPEYNTKEVLEENTITASGYISSSKLKYTQSVANKSTKTKPQYNVGINFNWTTPYYNYLFTDRIAVAWGGGLNSKNISSSAYYYNTNTAVTKWSKLSKNYSWSKSETPNKGIVFSTNQTSNVGNKLKTGYVFLDLYQNKKVGKDTKIVSQFAHQIVKIGGVSISGSPSITIGTGYNKSQQRSSTITY